MSSYPHNVERMVVLPNEKNTGKIESEGCDHNGQLPLKLLEWTWETYPVKRLKLLWMVLTLVHSQNVLQAWKFLLRTEWTDILITKLMK